MLIVEGYTPPAVAEGLTENDAADIARKLISEGMKPSDACKEAAKQTGFKKSDIYRIINE